MQRWVLAVAVMASAIVIAGCIPKRIVWAPNGQRAAVVADDGLYLCDAEGNLSPRFADAVPDDVTGVAWLPDSRRLLVLRRRRVGTWETVEGILSEAKREVVAARAEQFRADALKFQGDWDQFETTAYEGLLPEEDNAVRLYLREHLSEGLAAHVSKKWWNPIKNASVDVRYIQLFEVSDGTAAPSTTIIESLYKIYQLRVSPNGRYAAYVAEAAAAQAARTNFDNKENWVIFVVPIDGGDPARPVADYVGLYPDWSTDNRYLVYVRGNGPPDQIYDSNQLVLGALSRRKVCDEAGKLLAEFGSEEDLAGVIFSPWMKVRCLKDGRILFASAEVKLPSTKKDMPQHASLFAIDPDRHATVVRLIPRDAEAEVGDGLGLGVFEVSPDEARVAIGDSEGRVTVLDLASGVVVAAQPQRDQRKGMGMNMRTAPTWRSAEELCFAVPAGSEFSSANRAQIVLWSSEETRTISETWPDESFKKLLGP